jgi:Rod binding domain-containing protein
MNVFGSPSRIEAAQVPLENLATNAHVSDADKVAEVSRQFEAVLLRQILQDIRKPVLAPAEGNPNVNGIYDDMINNQMAENITRSGGLGLAKSLAGQLTHQVLPQLPSSSQASSAPVREAQSKKPFRK